ncbi:hypothetical protein Hanom_Chr09g00862021 [Helianthus anomalus]
MNFIKREHINHLQVKCYLADSSEFGILLKHIWAQNTSNYVFTIKQCLRLKT